MKSISTEGGVGDKVLLPREGREKDYYYAGKSGRQSVITQGGAREGLLLRREEWEVVVIVNTTG